MILQVLTSLFLFTWASDTTTPPNPKTDAAPAKVLLKEPELAPLKPLLPKSPAPDEEDDRPDTDALAKKKSKSKASSKPRLSNQAAALSSGAVPDVEENPYAV